MIITGENVPPGTTRFALDNVQRSEQTRNILWVDVVALNDEDDQLARWTVPGNGHGIHRDSLGPFHEVVAEMNRRLWRSTA